MLLNNTEHREAAKIYAMMTELCQAHGGNPEKADVQFGDQDGLLLFRLRILHQDQKHMLAIQGTLTSVAGDGTFEAPSFPDSY